MARAARDVLPEAEVIEHPISDGGEGLVDVLTSALEGTIEESDVTGPLPGQSVKAQWGLSADHTTAIIEMAAAAGWPLVPEKSRDPKVTTTFGVGELIRAALDHGVQSIIIGIGGSATNDGGAGLAEALGVRFLDASGKSLPRGGAALGQLDRIEIAGLDKRVAQTRITVACDVQNPLCGKEGASVVFGPQKGATPEDVILLDEALARYGKKIKEAIGLDVLSIPGGGAAGGLGVGLVAFCGAELQSGIDVVLDATGFDDHLQGVDLILTGEGKIDAQVKYGKALAGVMERGRSSQIPIIAVAGSIEGSRKEYLKNGSIQVVETLVDGEIPVEVAMTHAPELLYQRTRSVLQRYFSH